MKKYIVSQYGKYLDTDNLESHKDAYYYVEVINTNKKDLRNLKRCSLGSKNQDKYLRFIFNDNDIKINPYYQKESVK